MRIKAIELSWFRGAADATLLDLDCKSTIVYGVNGSGKSSFVDAVEYVPNDGQITLSGRCGRQLGPESPRHGR
jgi:chromosome segregation ATPase